MHTKTCWFTQLHMQCVRLFSRAFVACLTENMWCSWWECSNCCSHQCTKHKCAYQTFLGSQHLLVCIGPLLSFSFMATTLQASHAFESWCWTMSFSRVTRKNPRSSELSLQAGEKIEKPTLLKVHTEGPSIAVLSLQRRATARVGHLSRAKVEVWSNNSNTETDKLAASQKCLKEEDEEEEKQMTMQQ